ncbi:MAG: transcription repressor NadR [Lutispora sp.]|jgi:transcriptional regulator of NAD metabolism|uniref:transcription repressor NadR n=1 Tax=Lutispora sp. TaxID=2828727 RepID=UPI003564DACA
MLADERREEILSILSDRSAPITGTDLSKKTGVSRQVIVQDIAILRAKGLNIIATPQGYLLIKDGISRMSKVIACCHDKKGMRKELEIIVDNGGKVIDVTVEHSLYGEIKAMLMLESRLDIDSFMKHYEDSDTKPLSMLTGGVHLHTIEVPDETSYNHIINDLEKHGYLINNNSE